MDDTTLMMMLGGSLLLGGLGLTAFMWGLKTGQFDDEKRFTYGAMFDGEEELNDAVERQKKEKSKGVDDPK